MLELGRRFFFLRDLFCFLRGLRASADLHGPRLLAAAAGAAAHGLRLRPGVRGHAQLPLGGGGARAAANSRANLRAGEFVGRVAWVLRGVVAWVWWVWGLGGGLGFGRDLDLL